MHSSSTALLDLKKYTPNIVTTLFSLADRAKEERLPLSGSGHVIALLFLEPSTRTRLSFQTAAYRVGLSPLVLEDNGGSSLEKGETPEDTILNVAALGSRLIVIRCGDGVDLKSLSSKTSVPILNAGWGKIGHPTQALTDTYAMYSRWKNLAGKKLLFLGDAKHSRVVASHMEIASVLQLQLGYAGPKNLLPENFVGQHFDRLADGLAWSDAVMSLRFQFERHTETSQQNLKIEEFKKEWGLSADSLKNLKKDGLIMHPGPVHWGLEIESSIAKDPRCIILDQVRHGVWIREALLRNALGEDGV